MCSCVNNPSSIPYAGWGSSRLYYYIDEGIEGNPALPRLRSAFVPCEAKPSRGTPRHPWPTPTFRQSEIGQVVVMVKFSGSCDRGGHHGGSRGRRRECRQTKSAARSATPTVLAAPDYRRRRLRAAGGPRSAPPAKLDHYQNSGESCLVLATVDERKKYSENLDDV